MHDLYIYTADLFRCILRLNEEMVVLKSKVDSQNEVITSQNEEMVVLKTKVDTLERIIANHEEAIVVLKVIFTTFYILHYHQEHSCSSESFISPIFQKSI